jgi:FAD/FMN-containing dehydrogenase/Fe-S oxidoreductase
MIDELRSAITGEVLADRLSRALYATDASIYQIIPDAVVLPRSVQDVAAAVHTCAKYGIPLTARGAGTGLTGGAVNRGLQLDCSRHLTRILGIDPMRRTARVQPGVVLDELNAELAPHGLQFAPDVATSSRATIGGMIANDSCGARSILYGRTRDHLLSVDVVLSDGSTCTWVRSGALSPMGASPLSDPGAPPPPGAPSLPGVGNGPAPMRNSSAAQPSAESLQHHCERVLEEIARDYADEIAARFPKILRHSGGYALDRLRIEDGRINPQAVICGSEGTLAIVVGAVLKLTPLPRHKGLVLAHFDDLPNSLEATAAALRHRPAAVELVDKLVLDAARSNPAAGRRCSFIHGDPQAILMIELYADDAGQLARRLREVADDLRQKSMGYAWPILTDPDAQADVWEVRRSGLGLLMSRPGDRQPYAFVEDTAVEPARLRDYIERFRQLLDDERVEQAGYYAHAGAGCLHVRPVLNLRRRDDVERMRRIADRVSSLALEFGGAMTGEHGDGLVRSCWLEKMYGPRIVEAFGKIKRAFDPRGILNPGKIVAPVPMTENLRYEAEAPDASARAASESAPRQPDTILDFTAHGGMAGMAGMCSGVGQCRQRLVGTMCPSYMATDDEQHTTRARANTLRIALSSSSLLTGLSDPAIDEVMDLCLSCKACQAECPTGVDMARLKAEWLSRSHRQRGVPLRTRFIAAAPDLAALGSRCAPLANLIAQSRPMRALLERVLGLDRRVAPPRFADQTFREWFAHSQRRDRNPWCANTNERKPRVVYFVDSWTNFYTPQVGVAAVKVLETLGYDVIVPPTRCCGRPAISKGLLPKAKELAEANVAILSPYAARNIPIVGTEPSCILTLVDEYPQFVRTSQARRVAEAALTIESFVAARLRDRPDALRFKEDHAPLLYHGHCHQKALVGTDDARAVLAACTRGRATEINSGCCGLAGSFGLEVEHYDVAHAIGEQRLFPAVRARGDADIALSGFSCRQQIEHHTGTRPRHVIEYLADALA